MAELKHRIRSLIFRATLAFRRWLGRIGLGPRVIVYRIPAWESERRHGPPPAGMAYGDGYGAMSCDAQNNCVYTVGKVGSASQPWVLTRKDEP